MSQSVPRADWLTTHAQAFGAFLAISLLIRLALAPYGGHFFDIPTFQFWAFHLIRDPLDEFYNLRQQYLPEQDHLPGDLWILIFLTRFYQTFFAPDLNVTTPGFVWLLKLVPAIADIGVGLMLYLIGGRLQHRNAGFVAAALFLLNPASIVLTSVWGQWDSVSAFFALVALWCFLTGRLVWVLPALTYATLIKPQFGALLPLLALAYTFQFLRLALSRRDSPDGGLSVGAAVAPVIAGTVLTLLLAAAVLLPFGVGIFGVGHWSIVERMRIAVDLNKFTTLSAFNLWGAITPPTQAFHPDDVPFLFGVTYQVWGTVLTLAAYGFILVRYARHPTTQTLLWAALAIMLTLYVLPTRIHERYMLPALVLAALPAVTDRWYRRLFVVMSFTYLVNLLLIYTAPDPPAILDGARTSEVFWRVFSLANVAVLAVMLYRGPWSAPAQPDLEPPDPKEAPPEDAGGVALGVPS